MLDQIVHLPLIKAEQVQDLLELTMKFLPRDIDIAALSTSIIQVILIFPFCNSWIFSGYRWEPSFQRVEIAMMVTPDGHSRLEISRFLTPAPVADHRNAPMNPFGYLRAMFTVEDIDEMLTRLRKYGVQLVGHWFNMRTHIGCATFADPKDSSSG
jgi:hypothetical protein